MTRRHSSARWFRLATLLLAPVAVFAWQIGDTSAALKTAALQFDGTNDYVTFGTASGLGASQFTLEVWFNWTGGGGPPRPARAVSPQYPS